MQTLAQLLPHLVASIVQLFFKMIQTDLHYSKPVVFKMTTCNRDKFIQLDTYGTIEDILNHTHLKPVSYVSNDAGIYEAYDA